jgi:protein TonB
MKRSILVVGSILLGSLASACMNQSRLQENQASNTVPPVVVPDGDFRLVKQASLLIPPRAAARRVEGYVIVEYTVTEEGTTSDISVIESNISIFERAAIDAVRDYEFRPRIEGGIPVAVAGVRSRVVFEPPYQN